MGDCEARRGANIHTEEKQCLWVLGAFAGLATPWFRQFMSRKPTGATAMSRAGKTFGANGNHESQKWHTFLTTEEQHPSQHTASPEPMLLASARFSWGSSCETVQPSPFFLYSWKNWLIWSLSLGQTQSPEMDPQEFSSAAFLNWYFATQAC